MFTINHLSALVAAASFMSATSAASWTSSSVLQLPTPTAKAEGAATMDMIGCFNSSAPLDDHGPGTFQTDGNCQQICLGFKKLVLGLSDGDRCWCGDMYPAEDSKVPDTECDVGCRGSPKEVMCGGKRKWNIYNMNTRPTEPDYFVDDTPSSSSASSSAVAQKTSSAASTAAVTQTQSSAPPPENKPNTAGIAAGVVVGVVALAGIIGGVFFYLRHKKRRDVENEYRNRASVNNFVSGGKMHTSNSSMTDSRLDPEFMARRQSNGSIADNEDYSRRILKVRSSLHSCNHENHIN
ncbi:unnamed protein product [Periconia digitata]|uniref:WSC domain-containing protein n=1 Tax=Periconia digitata TaxID=1303443 RepID=A0A9W4UPQ0_9PLEO|nr:unnamed protein product [Periconia digitata]